MTKSVDRQVTNYLADLAAVGAPLPSGLRAAAKETKDRRVRKRLALLAERLGKGQTLEEILTSDDWPADDFTTTAIRSGIATKALGTTLSELTDFEDQLRSIRSQFWAKAAYPVSLIVLVLSILLLMTRTFGPMMRQIVEDYQINGQLASLNALEGTLHILFGSLAAIAAVALVCRLLLGAAKMRWMLGCLPVIGPLVQCSAAWEFATRLQLLIDRQVPLDRALVVISNESRDPNLSDLSRRLGEGVRRGSTIGDQLSRTTRIPATFATLVKWGEDNDCLLESLKVASKIFEGRLRLKHRLLAIIMPPIIYVIVGGIAFTGFTAVFLPLANLATWFTGAGGTVPTVDSMQLGTTWVGMIPLGISLWFAIHLLFSQQRQTPESYIHFALRVASIVMILLGLTGLLFSLNWMLGIPVVLGLLLVTAMIANRYRASETLALVWQMSIASRQGIPILMTARAFGRERTDEVGIRTMSMVEQVEKGTTLHQAITEARLPMAADLRMAIQSGLGNQYLTQVVTDSVYEAPMGLGNSAGQGMLHRFFYLSAVVFFGLLAWIFSLTRLIPTYQQIFDDFGLELTPITSMVVNFTESHFGVVSVVILVIMCVCLALLSIPVAFYYVGWLKWEPPVFRRLTARYHGAVVLRGLAAAVERNESLPDAVTHIAVAYPVGHVQQKVARAADSIAAGSEWVEALRKEQLIEHSSAAVLRSAERVGNLPWALREMSGNLLRNLSYRASAIMQVVTIAILLLISVPIGFFAVALFAPIPKLILALL